MPRRTKQQSLPGLSLESKSGAIFSDCRLYRYTLWRRWALGASVAFIGLNPSNADEVRNDGTVTRCINRAKALNFAGMTMLNLFGWRDTDPEGMKAKEQPIGPLNDAHILQECLRSQLVVCCWGFHGEHLDRANQVERMLRSSGVKLHHLGLTKNGYPRHPSRLGYDVKVEEWRA